MKKLFILSIFLFTLLASSADFGGSATLESNLVVKARPLPPAVGQNNAQEIADFSIASYLNRGFNLDRFTRLCSDKNRLKARLRTAASAIVKDNLCEGTTQILDSCFSANSVCDNLLGGGCSSSESELVSKCMQRWNSLKEENNANPAVRETTIIGRCNSINTRSLVEACLAGEPVELNIGLSADVVGVEESCVRQGFSFNRRAGRAVCESSSGMQEEPIFVEGEVVFPEGTFEEAVFDVPGELTEEELANMLPQEEILVEALGEEAAGEEEGVTGGRLTTARAPAASREVEDETGTIEDEGINTGTIFVVVDDAATTITPITPQTCPSSPDVCPSGYSLQSRVDRVTNCRISQCVRVVTSVTTPDSCLDSDGGVTVFISGTVSAISNGIKEQRADECASSTALSEFYCNANKLDRVSVACSVGCANNACISTTPTQPAAPATVTATPPTTTSTSTTTTTSPTSTTKTTSTTTTTPTTSTPTTTTPTTTSTTSTSTTTTTSPTSTATTPTTTTSPTSSAKTTTSTPTTTTPTTTTTATSPTTTSYTCTDSDGGRVFNVGGVVTLTSSTGTSASYSDICASGKLKEYFCSSPSAVGYGYITCSTGYTCSSEANACIASSTSAPATQTTSTSTTTTTSPTSTATTPTTTSPTSSAKTTTSTPTTTTPTTTTTTTTSKVVAPFTVKIIAVPTVLSGFVTASEVAAEAFTDTRYCTESYFVEQCKGQLRAASLGSFNPLFMQDECEREVKANSELVKFFCQRPDAAYNECTQHVESVCSKAREANALCESLASDKESLVEYLVEAVLAQCEADKISGKSAFGELASKLPPSSAFLATGADAKLLRAEVQVEKTTSGKDLLYSIQQTICLKYGDEKAEARICRAAVQDFDDAISLMELLKEQLSVEDKQFVDRELEKVKPKRALLAKKCAEKDKNAGGICSMVTG